MARIVNPWGDGRDADVSDEQCVGRPCLWVGENKGSYTKGRGYTSYHKHPWLECWTRHLHGCPYPKPEMDPEKVRCCPVPDFPKPREGQKPRKQRCRTCGEWASGTLLEARRTLPVQENVPCKHARVRVVEDYAVSPWEKWLCPECLLNWTQKPLPREPGETYAELLDRRYPKSTARRSAG